MDEKTARALLEANAVRKVRIVASGAKFHVHIVTSTADHTLCTLRGTVRSWSSLDSLARWTRAFGIGNAEIDLVNWQPGQKGLQLKQADKTPRRSRSQPEMESVGFDF